MNSTTLSLSEDDCAGAKSDEFFNVSINSAR